MARQVVARLKGDKWIAESAALDASSKRPYTGTIRPDARPRPKPGCHPEHKYECLVFKGGGAKGSIYPGAIRALEDAGVMPYIKRFAGASAGAITAALLAAGLTSAQLFTELATTDLKPLVLDSTGKLSSTADLYGKWGAHPGHGTLPCSYTHGCFPRCTTHACFPCCCTHASHAAARCRRWAIEP